MPPGLNWSHTSSAVEQTTRETRRQSGAHAVHRSRDTTYETCSLVAINTEQQGLNLLHQGIDQYLGPIDSRSALWLNRVVRQEAGICYID
jgi:hypothetical protein